MHNADGLTTIPHINRINVQYTIFAVRKVISHVIVTLKCKTIIFQDLHSPSINHDHHHVTSIRPQGDCQVLMAHPAYVGATITISVPLFTSMSPYHCSIQDLHHSIHARLQQGNRGAHLHHTLDQKTNCGNPCD